MFSKLNILTIIEYLLNEIDELTPNEEIYEKYCEELYKISKLNFNLTYTSFRQKFIMKITSMKKNEIIEFCRKEEFIIEIKKVGGEYGLEKKEIIPRKICEKISEN